jgi:uncharacterized protein GlcG (DUF336 family)
MRSASLDGLRRAPSSPERQETAMPRTLVPILLAAGAALALPAAAEDATYSVRMMTPEAAQKAAGAALAACRKAGYQVAVTVVDRAGLPLVMLRDRFAGPHTPGVATDKAWTAVTFRTDTTELEKLTRPGLPQSGLRGVERVTAFGGGLMIQAAGTLFGAIGVSGAPGGDADDLCARAGVGAVQADLEF